MASFFYSNDESAHIDTEGRKRPLLTPVEGRQDEASAPRRHEVTPPSQFGRALPLWRAWMQGFWRWLWDLETSPRALAPTTGLHVVKSEFTASLWDLQSLRANQVRDQIESARSLRELWHLRADVFKVISTHRGQIEAQLRLDALDSHFPVRASRKGDDLRGGARVTTW